MNRFRADTYSEAVVAAPRQKIWDVLTDPVLLPKLTPLLRQITTDGDLWTWHLLRISALGVGISPCFTERMRFDPEHRIDYSHEPPPGANERTWAEGYYLLSDVSDASGGTKLQIKLVLEVELPLPKVAGPAVTTVMKQTMQRTGDKFSANLLAHLGVSA